MEQAPECSTLKTKKEILDSITIKQDKHNYILNVELEGDLMLFKTSLKENIGTSVYSSKISFDEIKQMNKVLNLLNSCKEFYDYLKSLAENNKIFIKKNGDKLSINFNIDFLMQKESIEINLIQEKVDLKVIVRDICNELALIKEKLKYIEENKEQNENSLEEKIIQLEKENNTLKEHFNNELEILKEEIKKLKEENQSLKEEINKNKIKIPIKRIDSVIMNDNELDFIELAIKSRINKNIKEIKKLYQATIDGGDPIDFHKKCDNFTNTLTLIKSLGNRRFGGFTFNSWDSKSGYKSDNNAFIFSLDKKQIYPCINNNAILCEKNCGPVFGNGWDIWIKGNILKDNGLTSYKGSYDHDKNLLEVYHPNKTKALDYEVFQIIFS